MPLGHKLLILRQLTLVDLGKLQLLGILPYKGKEQENWTLCFINLLGHAKTRSQVEKRMREAKLPIENEFKVQKSVSLQVTRANG